MTLLSNGLANAAPFRFTYADATARAAASGFTSADLYSLALQLNDGSVWVLTATTPTWVAVAGSGLVNPMTTKGDLIAGAASGVATRLPIGTDGYELVADAAQTLGMKWQLPALTKYSEATLGADASTITVTIPAGYRGATIEMVGRTDEVATFSTIRSQINADSGANYDSQGLQGNGTTASAFQDVGSTTWHSGYLAGASAPASVPGALSCELKDYADTNWHKVGLIVAALKTANSNGSVFTLVSTNHWRSTAAITSVVFSIATGGRKFKQNTITTLYMRA